MKKNKSKHAIVTLDIYNQKYYKFSNAKVERLTKLKYNKSDVYVSYISNSDLIIEAIDLSASLPLENIQDVITDKVYEELKLDLATEYTITPIKTAIYRDNKVRYQALIVNKTELKKKLKDIQQKIKSIDYILAAPLLYKVFYANKTLESKDCDAFLYFGEKETFITFYYKGEYLYSKTVKYSIDYIYDRICQLAQEVFISKEDFVRLLATQGFRVENPKLYKLIAQVFDECFLNLNDIVIYTKRVYYINKINNLYIGFSFGYLDGINSYSKNYLSLASVPMSTLYSSGDPKTSIDPIHSLMLLNVSAIEKAKIDIPNFTPYPKPAPFFKRPVGRLFQAFLGIVLLFVIPIIYDYSIGLKNYYENKLLTQKEQKLAIIVNRYKKAIATKKEELKTLELATNKVKNIFLHKKGELETVYSKKFHYDLKSDRLALITNVLNSFDIKSRNITIDGNRYFIELESKDEKEITAFIKKLVEKFKNKISAIDIKDIKYDEQEHLYKGVLKVEFLKG